MGKPWENGCFYGKTMGKSWEIHDKWKFQWENHGKIMGKSTINGGFNQKKMQTP